MGNRFLEDRMRHHILDCELHSSVVATMPVMLDLLKHIIDDLASYLNWINERKLELVINPIGPEYTNKRGQLVRRYSLHIDMTPDQQLEYKLRWDR